MATRLPSGQYRTQVLVRKDASGKRLYKSFTADTADEADFLALEFKLKHGKNAATALTVRECVERYINTHKKTLSPTTVAGYKSKAKNYLGMMMDLKVSDLTSAFAQYAIDEELDRVSVKTVKEAYNLISVAIEPYLERPLKVRFPKAPAKKYATPDKQTLGEIIKASEGTSLEVPVLLAAWLSLRASEVCGLRWTDIKDHTVHVHRARVYADREIHEKGTKTEASNRVLPLPKHLEAALEKHRNDSDSEFVCPRSPQALYKAYSKMLEKNGIPHSRFHDLRHANASLMLLVMPNKYAQRRGGWNSELVMSKTYQQTFTPEEIIFAERFDEMFERDVLQHEPQPATDKQHAEPVAP